MLNKCQIIALLTAALVAPTGTSYAAKIADIANTKHNLSSTAYTSGTDDRVVKADVPASGGTDEICVFCHTPHKAQNIPDAPLWNRAIQTVDVYTEYASDSLDAGTLSAPDGSSKLCLSCHDGTLAIGSVGVINGVENTGTLGTDENITMTGTAADGTMPAGTPGHTRDLGTNLTNDHPISFKFMYDPVTSSLAEADGELVEPLTSTNNYIANRVPGASRPDIPLENDKVQCISCHDPHIRETDIANNGSAKFLRENLNRFQQSTPGGGGFDAGADIICLGCHKKEGWDTSIHALSTSTYVAGSDAVTNGGFPSGLPVWKAACLNCHDTHTVQGATRLLRGGVDGTGLAAQEETCYQCHDNSNNPSAVTTAPPEVGKDFKTAGNIRMPISSADLGDVAETHTIVKDAANDPEVIASLPDGATKLGKDLIEDQANLGNNRHVECSGCHNPHRVKKTTLFNGNGGTTSGAHDHDLTQGGIHTNIASGALSGSWGVEPDYTGTGWGDLPASYKVKRGAAGADTGVTNNYVTREYQICLKCHSDYAYGTIPPTLAATVSGTASGTNSVTSYTNQAMEFNPTTTADPTDIDNHSSWHPVILPTGRTATVRGLDPAAANQPFLAPWNDAAGADANIGQQSMYCSDCHGSKVTSNTSVVPDTGNPWGPHGSSNNFILKGTWDVTSGDATADAICFKCHEFDQYANPAPATLKVSGFSGTGNGCGMLAANITNNLHVGHTNTVGNIQCAWCHVAVPHGWQNKALLVDTLNDVVPGTATLVNSAGTCTGTDVGGCTIEPYYLGAQLGGGGAVNWRTSGTWTSADCGQGANWMYAGGAGAGAGAGAGGGNCPY